MIGPAPKSYGMSSTIIAPKSPPTYHALLRAKAGVASTVDDSATTMASFRINLPLSFASQPGTTGHSLREASKARKRAETPFCCPKAAVGKEHAGPGTDERPTLWSPILFPARAPENQSIRPCVF